MKIWLIALLGTFGLMNTSFSQVEGVWDYSAPTAPMGYDEGKIIITKADDDTYEVSIEIGGFKIPARDVELEDQTISFKIYVEDASIPITLTIDGDSMTGKADTPEGYVNIKGERAKE